jgi:hypothetical protein
MSYKIDCECGWEVSKSSMTKHKLTKKHLKLMVVINANKKINDPSLKYFCGICNFNFDSGLLNS